MTGDDLRLRAKLLARPKIALSILEANAAARLARRAKCDQTAAALRSDRRRGSAGYGGQRRLPICERFSAFAAIHGLSKLSDYLRLQLLVEFNRRRANPFRRPWRRFCGTKNEQIANADGGSKHFQGWTFARLLDDDAPRRSFAQRRRHNRCRPISAGCIRCASKLARKRRARIDGKRSRADLKPLKSVVMPLALVDSRIAHSGFAADVEDSSFGGNFGLFDLSTALLFVHRNARAFGGDPNRITLLGQSAGAASILALTISPYTRGWRRSALLVASM